jgi:hypothetical protein
LYPPQPTKRNVFSQEDADARAQLSFWMLRRELSSVDALFWLAEQGITLIAIDYTGETVASVPAVKGRRSAASRRLPDRQRAAAADKRKALAISRTLIERKLIAADYLVAWDRRHA